MHKKIIKNRSIFNLIKYYLKMTNYLNIAQKKKKFFLSFKIT